MGSGPSIRVFGRPGFAPLHHGGFFPTKGFQLIAILGRSQSGRVSRREAASLLWDCESEAAAFSNLRQLIARVRKGTPDIPQLLDVDSYSVGLGEGKSEVDLIRFQAAANNDDAGTYLEAVLMVRGELLEGVDGVTDQFAHWLTRERAALRERALLLASASLIELTKYGNASPRDLSVIAEKLLALEPEREQSYRVLVEAYGRNGMFDEASRFYDALRQMLEREHGVPPSPETAAVARRVFAARGDYRSATPPPSLRDERPRVAFLAPSFAGRNDQSGLLQYFVEDVANELGRHRSFVVLAPHSSFKIDHLSGMPVDNSVLRADYTVSGFVKPDLGGEVLALRMANCGDAEVVWSADFRVSAADLLQSFSLLTLRVASSLGSAIERNRLAALRKECNSSAYLHYLDGQRSLGNCDLPRLRRARKAFKRSVDANPTFAPPRARIAQTLYLEWIQLGGQDPDLLNIAREQAELALALDPNDAICHWMKGTVALYRREFDECEAKLAEAETLCPNSADLQVQYADALSHLGDPDAGWRKFERALDLNPLPPDHYWWAGASIAFRQQNYQKAVDLCGKLADDEAVLPLLAASYALSGDLETARAYGRRLRELFPAGLALEKSRTVTPDRLEVHRKMSLEGLRLADAI
jgi:pentatricopeptide repeat protein